MGSQRIRYNLATEQPPPPLKERSYVPGGLKLKQRHIDPVLLSSVHQAPTVPKYPGSPVGSAQQLAWLGPGHCQAWLPHTDSHPGSLNSWLEVGQKPSGVSGRATSRSTLGPLLELRAGSWDPSCARPSAHRIPWHNWHLQTQMSMSTTYTRTFPHPYTHLLTWLYHMQSSLVQGCVPHTPRLSLRHPDGGLSGPPPSTKALEVS